jgi:hypothetical protein
VRQSYYEHVLDIARDQLSETDPDIYCRPDYWELLTTDDVEPDRTIIQLALSDSCKEAGHLSSAAEFSAYYPD